MGNQNNPIYTNGLQIWFTHQLFGQGTLSIAFEVIAKLFQPPRTPCSLRLVDKLSDAVRMLTLLTLSTVTLISSETKLVTSVATMQIVERELIGLDDDVRKVVP